MCRGLVGCSSQRCSWLGITLALLSTFTFDWQTIYFVRKELKLQSALYFSAHYAFLQCSRQSCVTLAVCWCTPPNCLRLFTQWSLSSAMIKWWQPKRIIAKILLQFSFMVAFYANLFVNPDSLTDMNYMKCSRVLRVQVIGLFLKRVQNSVSPVSGWQATLVLSRHKVKKCLNMLGPLFIWSPSHTADNPVILTDVSTWIWPCLCQNLMSTYFLHFFFAWYWLSTVWGSGGASCYRSRLLINNARSHSKHNIIPEWLRTWLDDICICFIFCSQWIHLS